jgi:hypothetical protein
MVGFTRLSSELDPEELHTLLERFFTVIDTIVDRFAGHDTAAAVAATPFTAGRRAAFLSSGTWSLLGREIAAPDLSASAIAGNFTNECGVGGMIIHHRILCGLWLLRSHVRFPLHFEAINNPAHCGLRFTSVINALRLLEREGLLEIRPYSGWPARNYTSPLSQRGRLRRQLRQLLPAEQQSVGRALSCQASAVRPAVVGHRPSVPVARPQFVNLTMPYELLEAGLISRPAQSSGSPLSFFRWCLSMSTPRG